MIFKYFTRKTHFPHCAHKIFYGSKWKYNHIKDPFRHATFTQVLSRKEGCVNMTQGGHVTYPSKKNTCCWTAVKLDGKFYILSQAHIRHTPCAGWTVTLVHTPCLSASRVCCMICHFRFFFYTTLLTYLLAYPLAMFTNTSTADCLLHPFTL